MIRVPPITVTNTGYFVSYIDIDGLGIDGPVHRAKFLDAGRCLELNWYIDGQKAIGYFQGGCWGSRLGVRTDKWPK